MEAFVGGRAGNKEEGASDSNKEALLMQSLMHPGHSHENRANTQFWFQFELRQYPTSKIDVDGLFAVKEKFVPAVGIESGDDVRVAPIAGIAQAMGKDILRLAGGLLGFMTDPKP